MTTQTLNGNGRTRKSLADQIDRLDHILDGLANALNESIADAVKDVIGQVVADAVQVAVKEVLASPELLCAALEKHAPPEPPPPPLPPKPPTLKEKLASACKNACEKVKQAGSAAKSKLREIGNAACAACKTAGKIASHMPGILSAVARKVWSYRKPCAVAVGVGVACGAACYLGGRMFSSIANGLGGAALTLSAMILPLKNLLLGSKTTT